MSTQNDRDIEKNVWIFQANPRHFNILKALKNPKYKWDNWKVTRYRNKIKKDDLAIIWISGNEAGIYAKGDIISDPHFTDKWNRIGDDDGYVMNNEEGEKELEEAKNKDILKVTIQYSKIFHQPLLKEGLQNIVGLKNLSIITMPRGTNFKVTIDEWRIISNLIEKKTFN